MLRALSLRSIGLTAARNLVCRHLSTTPVNAAGKHLRIWRPFDDSFFNTASQLMRSLEREFDSISRQFMGNGGGRYMPFGLQRFIESAHANDLVVTDKDGNRKFQLVLELGDFKPEEIKVKTQGKLLNIFAKKESKSEDEYFLREFSQSYRLPKDLKLEDLKSKWTEDGRLIIDAPLPKQIPEESKVKEIPIEHGQNEQKSK